MAQLSWNDLMVDKIREIIDDNGFDLTPLTRNSPRADLVNWLQRRNLQPLDFIGNRIVQNVTHHAAPAAAAAPPVPPVPKLDCRQQDNETVIDFIRRFDCALDLHHIPQANHVALFQLNLQPKYAHHISDLDPNIRQDYTQTKDAILQLCQVNKFQFQKLFQTTPKGRDESFRVYAGKLHNYYTQYAGISQNDYNTIPQLQNAVHAAILPRLFSQISSEIQHGIRNYALTHTYAEVLQEMDNQTSLLPPRTPCPNHPNANHSAAQCRQRPTTSTARPPATRTPTVTPHHGSRPPTNQGISCFRCGKPGHVASRCPPSGNV